MAMIDMNDKCITIRCSIKAKELLSKLEFGWEGDNDEFSFVKPMVEFCWNEGENVGDLKLSPSFLECLCNGGRYVHYASRKHTLYAAEEHEEDASV